MAQIREHWSQVRIVLRADSGFCREEVMRWCEDNSVCGALAVVRPLRLLGVKPKHSADSS